jgi:hypothetical protein
MPSPSEEIQKGRVYTGRHALRFDQCPSVLTIEEAAAILRWNPETLEARMDDPCDNRNPIPYIFYAYVATFPAKELEEWANREARL